MEKTAELLKISASSVKSYDQCPRKYFYNYIQKVPKKEWAHFDLGNFCHKVLEFFHLDYINNGTKKSSLTKIMGASFEEARKSFPNMNDDMLLDAKGMLADYLAKIKKTGMPLVKGVETSFSFNITENILIRGFLDRLDITKDGMFEIIDYKTTKNPRYLDEFQLLVYGLWLQKEYPHVDKFKGTYVLLRHGSKTKDYIFNMEDVEKVRKNLIDYANNIRNEDSWTPIPNKLCDWCDFKDICPAQEAW